MKYAIEVRGRTYRFASIGAAKEKAAAIFAATGVIVGIYQVAP